MIFIFVIFAWPVCRLCCTLQRLRLFVFWCIVTMCLCLSSPHFVHQLREVFSVFAVVARCSLLLRLFVVSLGRLYVCAGQEEKREREREGEQQQASTWRRRKKKPTWSLLRSLNGVCSATVTRNYFCVIVASSCRWHIYTNPSCCCCCFCCWFAALDSFCSIHSDFVVFFPFNSFLLCFRCARSVHRVNVRICISFCGTTLSTITAPELRMK